MRLCNPFCYFKADSSRFESSEVEQVFRSDSRFKDLRVNSSSGELTECDYVEPDDWAIIRLSKDREWISISNTGSAALRAVLILQKRLGIPLHVFDTSYTFDL